MTSSEQPSDDPRSGFYQAPLSAHALRAIKLLRRAAGEIESRLDPLPAISEAEANIRADDLGELSSDAVAELQEIADADESEV